MVYVLFVLVATLSVVFVMGIAAQKGVVDCGKKIKIYKSCEDDSVIPFRGKQLGMLIIICFVMALALQISLYKNTSILNVVKLYGVFVIVFCAAVVDIKRRIIPNFLIVIGLIFRLGVYVYELVVIDNIQTVLLNDLIGFAIGFVFLAIVSLLTRGALGFGDAKLFGVIGLTCGSFCTYSTLLLSLVISAVVSIVNIARKKMGRKDSFPFGPCIAIGYAIAILLTSY